MKKLALTGGPCAGKTTALAYVSEKLLDRGFYPLIVPEAPTLLMLGNATPYSYPERVFQKGVVRLMHEMENVWSDIARSKPELNPVLICDRGIPDCPPYFSNPATYEEILTELGLGTVVEVRDKRYGGVFHLRSAAVGAEEFYTRANNVVRRETVEEARVRDEQTLAAWVGHPHLRIIDNSTDFAGKMKRLDQDICRILGIPVPLEIENKYLCAPVKIRDIPLPCQRIEIEQVYLYTREKEKIIRVRKRGQNGSYVYFKTEKTEVRPGVRVETEDFITEQEYNWSLNFMSPGTKPIKKQRFCFVSENQYFELDMIPVGNNLMYLLEIELTEEGDRPRLPNFLTIEKEVTDDPRYTNRALAEAA